MSLNDNRWGRHLDPLPEDEEKKAPADGGPGREPAPGPDSAANPETRPEDSVHPEDARGGRGGAGGRPESPEKNPRKPDSRGDDAAEGSRRSARDLEAEWQSFNDLLSVFRGGGSGRRPAAPGGRDPRREFAERALRSKRVVPLLGVIAVFAVGAYLGAGFYTVPAGETAALYASGEFSRLVGPGTHWHMPWPFEKVRAVDTRLTHRNEVVFSGSGSEGYLMTADGCLVRAKAVAQWKVSPEGVRNYLEHVASPSQAISAALRRALRAEFGDMTVRDAMGGRPSLIGKKLAAAVQAEAESLGLGIAVTSVEITETRLPAAVEDAMRQPAEDQDREAGAFRAAQRWAALADTLSVNTARKILEEAESYRQRVTHVASADTDFLSYLHSNGASEADREAAVSRAWAAAMEAALPNPGELSGASAGDIMAVIRAKRPAAATAPKAAEGEAVTQADIEAARKAAEFERKKAASAAEAAAASGSPADAAGRDETQDRSAYLRNRGR